MNGPLGKNIETLNLKFEFRSRREHRDYYVLLL